jgi:DNA polymerase V
MFAIIDCNNFYASCERLFRPDLKHVPIVVLSNNDGCCIARSDEAKALGIAMAAPYFEIKELCDKNKVKVFSSNYTLYGDISHRVMITIKNAWPDVEVYSIDEAFLDLRTLPLNKIDAFCISLQKTILQHTGITTSVGIGRTKTLAKAANYLGKRVYKVPVFNVCTDRLLNLKKVPIEEVWGVGRAWAKKLVGLGILTAFDLANSDEVFLREISNVVLTRTTIELKGTICHELQVPKLKQNIISSRSFGTMQFDLAAIEQAISSYCTRAVEKMRMQNLLAKKIEVFLQTNRFRKDLLQDNQTITTSFIIPTDDLRLIVKTAKQCLQKIFKQGFLYKKVGVVLGDLTASHIRQFDIFEQDNFNENQRSKKFMDVLDKINKKYGRSTL